MSDLADLKARLRDQAELQLRLAALRDLRGDAPSTVEPYRRRGDRFWRLVFVPLYRRIPWTFKQRVMKTARMTARGWTPPSREPGQPWRPPPPRE